MLILNFSEYGHVVYQIKADDACSIMIAIFCPQTHPKLRGWGQKVKPYLFVKVVVLHIKLKGAQSALKANMLP